MPRPTAQGRSEVYHQHSAHRRALNEHNDCAVRAVAAATGRAYDEVHALFRAAGRRDAAGTPINITRHVLKLLGYEMRYVYTQDIISQYPSNHARVLKSVTTHHPDRFNKVWANGKTYFMFTPGHILAVVNGVNHDWTRGHALRAISLYEMVPA